MQASHPTAATQVARSAVFLVLVLLAAGAAAAAPGPSTGAEEALALPGPRLLVDATPPPPGQETLFTTFPGRDAVAGNIWTVIDSVYAPGSALPGLTFAIADDFEVPFPGWRITRVDVFGTNLLSDGEPQAINVYVFTDQGGYPSSWDFDAGPVYKAEGITTFVDRTGGFDFDITLPTPAELPAGRYWISVLPVMDPIVEGLWAWSESALVGDTGTHHFNESVWRHNTDLRPIFNTAADDCGPEGWYRRITDCDLTRPMDDTPYEYDMSFQLIGEQLSVVEVPTLGDAGVALLALLLATAGLLSLAGLRRRRGSV